jgi:hypothetical protein
MPALAIKPSATTVLRLATTDLAAITTASAIQKGGLLEPVLQAVQGLSRPAGLRRKHDQLPIGKSASIMCLERATSTA